MMGANTASMLVSSTGRIYRLLPGQETVIGSVGCAVMLREPGVLPRHARIVVDQGYLYVEDLGGGVLLNGKRVIGRTALHDGDTMRVSTAELVFKAGTTPMVTPHGAVQAHVRATPPQPVPSPTVPPAPPPRIPPQPTLAPRPIPSPAMTPVTPRPQPTPPAPMVVPPRTPPIPLQRPVLSHPIVPPLGTQLVPLAGTPQTPALVALPAKFSIYGQPHVQGKVIHVDGPHMEEPDFNLAVFLLKATLWLFLFPIFIWKPSLISLFLHGRKDNKVPTRYVRVQDSIGQEIIVRMKGDIARGAVGMGDLVSFWGRLERGTLQMHYAFNHQINADIQLR